VVGIKIVNCILIECMFSWFVPIIFRFITFYAPADIKVLGGVDLKTLRAIRVLRPLKLVSGVPSK
jgi:hypothetical protein